MLLRGCRCARSYYDLELTFDLANVTLTSKIFSEPYLENHKVTNIDIWQVFWLGGVGVQCNFGFTFDFAVTTLTFKVLCGLK